MEILSREVSGNTSSFMEKSVKIPAMTRNSMSRFAAT